MASLIKCYNCNIVIDELLSYIQNKISISDEVTLVKICASTFTKEQIQKSHSLLFESVPAEVRKTGRRGKGKEKDRLLYDMLSFIKITDPDVLPIFVARDLDKLPPLTFDHLDVSKLLKDLSRVQADIALIKSSYVTTEQFENLRTLCSNKQNTTVPSPCTYNNNVNTKRGAFGNNRNAHNDDDYSSPGNNSARNLSPQVNLSPRMNETGLAQSSDDSLSADRQQTINQGRIQLWCQEGVT
ncbi:unnamed protein product [Pieris macdunnoughi]|uniref:Mutant cadherin n=1 Tax=Pieris macdunnoughi TaxID=345717 RepID=A0A821PFB6_9NEOP|nr:unnamed protein product [Pieris macdunnoughi]